jgi:hypothetical protein
MINPSIYQAASGYPGIDAFTAQNIALNPSWAGMG